MSVLSKYFEDAISSATCRDIVHPHTDSCWLAASGYFFKPIWSTVQFFVPLFMISVAARKEKMDQQALIKMLKNLVGAVSAALLTGSIGTICMCGLYNLFNRFHYSTLVGMPGFLGALSIFAVPNQIAIMFSHSALVMVIQTLIKRRGDIFFKSLDQIRWFRTLVFMLFSAMTLDSLRKVKPDISWFIQPVRRRSKRRYECYDRSPVFDSIAPVTGNVCSHRNGCDKFILEELKTYMKIGIAIELIRSILKHFDQLKRHFFKGIWMIISKFNIKFTLFAVGYPSGYRILTCFFNRLYGFESKFANLFAAFLASGFFYLHPQISILSYCMACTIEILWQRIQRNKHRKLTILRKINELPLARISYPIFMGFLFHMRTFYPWQSPSLIYKIVNFVTCRHYEKAIKSFESLFWFGRFLKFGHQIAVLNVDKPKLMSALHFDFSDEQMLLNCYSYLIPSSV